MLRRSKWRVHRGDEMTAILAFLLALGCDASNTEVVVYPELARLGQYSGGVVTVRSLDNEAVLVHELYHSCQRPAANGSEGWWRNERDAHRVEQMWKER